MKLSLTFTERYMLNSILTPEDSFQNLLIRKDLAEKLKVEQKDLEENDFKIVGDSATWKDTGNKVDVEFSESETMYIKNKLQALDKAEKLNAHFIDVYKAVI